MKSFTFSLFALILLTTTACVTQADQSGSVDAGKKSDVEIYVTTETQSMLFQQVLLSFDNKSPEAENTITLNPEIKYQEMDGFGAAITGSTCYNLLKMTPVNRAKILKETFDPEEGMGYS
jgi:glucosylceramidase